ncbi:amidohydrolase family protein [Streptomyces sp. NPDC020792]|uniref:amidohydrolase family protein n=1 Tax=Streptomyces sp. NPDC020792 TaxID=3365089 RepID=UPI0037AC3E1A
MTDVDVGSGDRLALAALTQYRMTTTEQMHLILNTFPHCLGHYARELGLLSMGRTVAHLTSRPAVRQRLPDRGLVREGYRADLVLSDPDTVAAGSTVEAPRTLPVGIPHVLVDGRFVIEDGRRTDMLAGRSVRGTPCAD